LPALGIHLKPRFHRECSQKRQRPLTIVKVKVAFARLVGWGVWERVGDRNFKVHTVTGHSDFDLRLVGHPIRRVNHGWPALNRPRNRFGYSKPDIVDEFGINPSISGGGAGH